MGAWAAWHTRRLAKDVSQPYSQASSMAVVHESTARRATLADFWQGQICRFNGTETEAWSSIQGLRLVGVFLVLEAVVRPALNLVGGRYGWAARPEWMAVEMGVLLVVTVGLATLVARVNLDQLGIRRWAQWTWSERLYFIELVSITIIIFSLANWTQVHGLLSRPDVGRIIALSFLPQLAWGLYQELLYRAILQTELVRRWGKLRGIVVGNIIFTFGPLHFYHFGLAAGHPEHLWIFAAIFSIGLYFGLIYEHSRNLWIVGVLHGLGDWFLVGLAKIPKAVPLIRP